MGRLVAIAQPPPRAVNTSLLLKTGQTTVYVAGDNGTNQVGIARSYTLLNTGQYAGNKAITINSKTDNHTNVCVLDNNTGLMWLQRPSTSVGPASDGKIPWTTTGSGGTAEGIFPYVAAANAAAVAGYSDWRIPNTFEYYSIMTQEAPNGNPNVTYFPVAVTCWTSTTKVNGTANAFLCQWSIGRMTDDAKTANYQVYLVRGGNP